ncbi:MAG: beta-lactamase family protein [Actinomycetota bacterium]|nr:beta-lactamase family protein [Actinomycetota bacterium]
MSSRLGAALSVIDQWPVATSAIGVIGRDGLIEAHGDTDHEFWLASVTKPLAVLAMLVAVEEEAVELSQPAHPQLLPGATLRHLLSHASGVAPERHLRSFPPGVRRVYSNVGIELAGELVEAAVEMPFASYMDEALIQPLGLTHTELRGSAARDGWSSVADLAVVMHRLIAAREAPDFVQPATVYDAATVQYPGLRGVLPGFGGQDPNDWGLGFEIRGDKHPHWTGARNSPATFGHFGQSGTAMWIDPAVGIGLVALTDRNFDDWARAAWPAVADAVLAAL